MQQGGETPWLGPQCCALSWRRRMRSPPGAVCLRYTALCLSSWAVLINVKLMNLSLLCLLGWALCHHEAALRLPDPSCATSDQAGAQGSRAPLWLCPSVWAPLQGEVSETKTPLLAPDFPAQRQDNVCYLQNYKRDVEIIKGEGRGQLPSLSLTWKAQNPDAQLWKIFFQQQHLPPWQALQASCLGSSAVASWFITWIC